MSKKVLIIGADGQLAYDLMRVLEKDYQIFGSRHSDFGVENYEACELFIKKIKPNFVINTAAFHNTSECELNPNKSFLVNSVGAYNVSKASTIVDATTIFISTNYVFDGNKASFDENDCPNPLNIYGASKLTAEILTKITNKKSIIIRTSVLFGLHRSGKGHNFVSMMLEKAQNEKELKVVNDEYSSFTYSFDLATKIKELIDRNVTSGIYHITNSGWSSWYEFTKEILKISGVQVKIFPIRSSSVPSILIRPKYSGLISKNLKKVGVKKLRHWKQGLKAFINETKN